MQGVMKIVAPLRLQRKAAMFARPKQARIVQITFGNQAQRVAKLDGELFHLEFELFQERVRREIVNRMNSIQP